MKSLNLKLLFVFTLVILDFLFTYIGIQIGIFTEANPFVIWLFNLDFIYALIIKIFYTSILLALISNFYDCKKKIINSLMNICFSAYAIINIFHISVFYLYLTGGTV